MRDGRSPQEALRRAELLDTLTVTAPWDDQERSDLCFMIDWVGRGAPLYRTRKPDVPDTHLVSYFVVVDPEHRSLLLVEHLGAGLLLPTGGHVEPLEDPWDTVRRECPEELFIQAEPLAELVACHATLAG